MGKILVVDDDKNIRDVFKRAFVTAGHEVMLAKNGIECESMFEKYKPHVIILDILMPHQEGLKTIFNLRQKNKSVKIIAVSGGGMGKAENYLDNALKFGAKAVYEKPVNITELINKVDLILQS